MKSDMDALQEIEDLIDAMLMGCVVDEPLDIPSFPQSLQSLVKKINQLGQDLSATLDFGRAVSKGQLDIEPPHRSNYLAAPMKEIHSQLISFCWSIAQLIEGNMVSKLFYPGELFESYNSLVDKVSLTFGNLEKTADWGGSVSSWRYHQILSALNQLHIMIMEVSVQGTILFANPPAREIFPDMTQLPYDQPERDDDGALMKYLCTFAKFAPELAPSNALTTKFPIFYELFDPVSGSWYKITSDRVNLTDGTIGLLHMIDDISEWKRHEHQLTLTATIDPLTSAYTRKAGTQKLEELITFRHVQQNCVAFVDVDGLKQINDQYGHNEGDFTIKTIAGILISCVRKTDWVVRYGGDEFLLLFLGCEVGKAQEAIDRMYQQLKSVNEHLKKPYELSFSLGISPITENMGQITDLITVIDQYMYENKQARKALLDAKE